MSHLDIADKSLQPKGTAKAKTLRCKCVWGISGARRRLVLLEQ